MFFFKCTGSAESYTSLLVGSGSGVKETAPLARLQAARQLARLPHARRVALPRHVAQVVEAQRVGGVAAGGALEGEGARADLPRVFF